MILFAALIVINGCTHPEQGAPDSGDSGVRSEEDGAGASSQLNGASTVAANPYNAFSALVTVTVDRDAEVTIEYGEGSLTHATPAARASAGEPLEILVLGLRADRDYVFEATASAGGAAWRGEALALQTEPLPVGWPVCWESGAA